jgi:hypothetical protein
MRLAQLMLVARRMVMCSDDYLHWLVMNFLLDEIILKKGCRDTRPFH